MSEEQFEIFPEHVLLDLAHGVLGQFVDGDDALGDLELGEFRLQPPADFPLVDGAAIRGHHDADDALAEIGMRHADHGGFGGLGNRRLVPGIASISFPNLTYFLLALKFFP